MASHTTLNEDVLRIIFDHLNNLQPGDGRGKALVNAAMTCKDFYQPGLRMIWRSLDDLFPLFELFSAFVKVGIQVRDTQDEGVEETDLNVSIYMIDGAIIPQEWERFRMYAEFVRELGYYPLSGSDFDGLGESRCIASSTVSCLGKLAGGTPLLPNLRTLRWEFTATQCTAFFPLISPSIDMLGITLHRERTLVDGERRQWHAFLTSTLFLIVSVSIHITDLNFDGNEDLPIAEPVSQLQSLRRFATTKADEDLLCVLAALPNLREMRLGSIVVSDHDSFMQAGVGFHRLERLSVVDHPKTARFYRLFGASCLRYLRANFRQVDDHRDILACCSVWAQHFPWLEELALLVFLKQGQGAAHHHRPYASICEPLFQLRSLKSVDLDVSSRQFLPNDADIEAVAHSWPGLVRFWAGDYDLSQLTRVQEEDPCLSASALVLLASRCPQLHSLHVPRVKINLASVDALSNFPVLDHRLHTLFICTVYANDCALASLLIDQLFPNLHLDVDIIPGAPQLGNIWDQVVHHVKVFQTARKQQVQRMTSGAKAATAT